MVRLIFGAVLIGCGVITWIGLVAEGSFQEVQGGPSAVGPGVAFLVSLVYLLPGIILLAFGIRFLRQRGAVITAALAQLRANDHIDVIEILSQFSGRFSLNELKVRKYIAWGQGKGLIPWKAEVV